MQASLMCGFAVGKAPRDLDVFASRPETSDDTGTRTSSQTALKGSETTIYVAVCQAGACQIWQIARFAQELLASIRLPQKAKALACRFSFQGTSLALVSSQKEVSIWDWTSETCRLRLHGHLDDITGCEYFGLEQGRELLASFGADGKVLLWDTDSDDPTALDTLQHSCTVHCVHFVPCQDSFTVRIFVGLVEGSVFVWDVHVNPNDLLEPVLVSTLREPAGYLYSLSATPSGHRLCVGAGNGAVSVWNALPLKLASAARQTSHELRIAGTCTKLAHAESNAGTYVGMPEDCFQVADGGASGLDECQREFEATLLEYQFEDQDQDQGANTSTLSLARDQLTYNNHLEPASQASSEIPTTDLERLHDIMLGSSCIKSAFASGSKAGPNETAVLFTSSAEGRVGAWCADSGRRLFEAKLAAPLLAMKVVVAEASRSGLSRYFIFGTCMHEAVGFEVRGLDELQALADFVSSADVTTCEAYWAHAQRRAALERALGILGLQGTTQERQKLATLMDQRSRLGEAMQHHTRPQQLVHAASAEHFLRTLIGRIEKRTGRELYSRVLSATREIDLNTETLCKCIVSCPFAIEGILDAIAMPATTFLRSTSLEKDRFMQAVKGTSGEPPRAFLERLGLVILPLAQRNAWGGDARVGMFLKPAPFFYACTDVSAAEAASTADALAAGNPLIAPLYALGEAKEAEEVRRLQEAHEREMQRDAETQDQILSPPLLVRQLEVPHVPEKRDPISPCSGPSKRSPSPHGDLADQASTSCTPTLPYASDASEIALHSAGLAVDVNAALKLDALPTKSLAAYTEELSLAGSETSKLQRPKADWFRPGELAAMRAPGCLALSPAPPSARSPAASPKNCGRRRSPRVAKLASQSQQT